MILGPTTVSRREAGWHVYAVLPLAICAVFFAAFGALAGRAGAAGPEPTGDVYCLALTKGAGYSTGGTFTLSLDWDGDSYTTDPQPFDVVSEDLAAVLTALIGADVQTTWVNPLSMVEQNTVTYFLVDGQVSAIPTGIDTSALTQPDGPGIEFFESRTNETACGFVPEPEPDDLSCDWEWGGVAEDEPEPCDDMSPIAYTGPEAAAFATTADVMNLGFALGLFLLAAHVIGSWRHGKA